MGHPSDHLVKGDTSVDDHVLDVLAHAPVHLLVAQAEHDCLIAHESLVVRLDVADDLLLRSSAVELVPHPPHIPLLIAHLGEELDPHGR